MRVTIRPEQSNDLAAITAVIEAAFSASQYGLNNEPRIVQMLRKSSALTVSLVAESSESVLGHVAVSPVQITDGTQGWFGLGPISILPEHQCKGIGTRLMREALAVLKRRGAQGCVVAGDPDFYGRFGFNNIPDLVYAGVPAKYFQALKFGSGYPNGSVSYHEAFAAES